MADSAPSSAVPQSARPGKLLEGKRGVIMGAANNRSLAWGIAGACAAQGAELAFTFQGEALERRVRPLAASIGSDFLVNCDVVDEASIDQAFHAIAARWDRIDFLVHAIAYADKASLRGRYVDTPRAAFLQAMDISCYSLLAVAQRALPLMRPGGSILTLSYYGAEKWIPHYNVMGVAKAALEASVRYMAADLGSSGIRVNAISAGPIKTLAASGIGDFHYLLRWNQLNAPMRRNVTIDDVGGAGVYLVSDLSGGVTGEVHHVDAGYHIIGMKHPEAPDIAIEQG
ncbi:MAG: enoyl-[acyl-carrier-protein] reductase FabI [Acetobacteraceae bacterium]|nr:enoyl-[acyl-carrier-protein] reductase FabI [Acetobacteraceae bacterium]